MSRDYFNIDAFRYGIERMEPAHYLRAPYFERWLASIELNLIEGGFVTGEELDARTELLRDVPRPRFRAASPSRSCRSAGQSAETLRFRYHALPLATP